VTSYFALFQPETVVVAIVFGTYVLIVFPPL